MNGGWLIVLIVIVAGAVAIGSFVLNQKRRDDLAAFAKRFGLTYTREDASGMLGYPFRLFGKGDGRGCENVLSGSWQGLAVREADYWYYDESTDSKGQTSKTYHRFSVALVDLALQAPYVSIERENLLTLAADHLGLRDIDFESEDFNRGFNVKSPDEEFAFKIVDARMERFLLESGDGFAFEFTGPALLVSCHRLGPMELVPLFGAAKGFVDHIPRLVWNEYGTGAREPT